MALEGQREVLTFGPHNFPGHKILTIGPHNHKILTIGPHIFPGHKILTIGPHIFPGHNFPLALGPKASFQKLEEKGRVGKVGYVN